MSTGEVNLKIEQLLVVAPNVQVDLSFQLCCRHGGTILSVNLPVVFPDQMQNYGIVAKVCIVRMLYPF